MVTEGLDYSLVPVQLFFWLGFFRLHCTLGDDNRWSYHYCKTHNPHSNSLWLSQGLSVCVGMCAHPIIAHYSSKSDSNPQTAAGCSLHLHCIAVIVLIAIWTNYWGNKANPDWAFEGLASLCVQVFACQVKSRVFIERFKETGLPPECFAEKQDPQIKTRMVKKTRLNECIMNSEEQDQSLGKDVCECLSTPTNSQWICLCW